jgi:ubiquitin carboxyl-terminal hydrolase L3
MSSLTLHLHTENNPDVMSHLLHQLGLSPSIGFHDVYSIDDADLLAFVPRPAYALLFVFPVSETYEKFRLEEDEGSRSTRALDREKKLCGSSRLLGTLVG